MSLILKTYAPHSMAFIYEDDTLVYVGNNWDFHAGCCGTKLNIGGKRVDFKDVWNEDIRSPVSVVKMISEKMNIPYTVERLTDEEYKELI